MIYASNFYITGSMSNIPVYTNNLTPGPGGLSNVTVKSDIVVEGTVKTTGRMDVGNTMYATFRMTSNAAFSPGVPELFGVSNMLAYDFTAADMSAMSNMTMAVPRNQIYNQSNGVITVPVSGLYTLQMQGAFSNSMGGVVNGVYYRFLNHSHSNARIAPRMGTGELQSTSVTAYLLAGDLLQPTYYSTDPNAVLVGENGETFVSFAVHSTVTPTHSNYFRV